MTLASSFSGKKCLVVADSPDLARLFLHSLRQLGMRDGNRADTVEDAKKHIYQIGYDIVICVELKADGFLDVLRAVRFDAPAHTMRIPVVCFSENWSPELTNKLVEGGISLLGAIPFSLASLLKTMTKAFSGAKNFITISSYHGPCRRLRDVPNYKGPYRRAADLAGEKKTTTAPRPISRSAPQGGGVAAEDDFERLIDAGKGEIYYGNATMQQTKVVIDDACLTGSQLSKLSGAMRLAKTTAERADFLKKVAITTERMVNLLTLANARIEVHGCDEHLLGRLGEIRASMAGNTEGMAEAAAGRALDYGKKILMKGHGFPLGATEFMMHQVMRMDTVIQVIGGIDRLSEEMQKLVAEAKLTLKKITEKEKEISKVTPNDKQ